MKIKDKILKIIRVDTLIMALFIASVVSVRAQSIIELGDKREIFIDKYLIDNLDDVKLVLHHPEDKGAVFYFDKPWEGVFSGYVTIIEDNNLLRAYYRGVPEALGDGNEKEKTCYAESKDGINWVKPDLKNYKINGTYNNNVVLANEPPFMHNFSPFLDKNPKVKPEERYKALSGVMETGLVAYVSSDGKLWKKKQQEPVYKKGVFDSQNVAFWSESEKQYVCYFRTWSDGDYSKYKGYRTVARTTSPDFISWSEPSLMTFGNTPMEHLYTHQTSPYFRAPHIYVAIGGRFMPGRQVLTKEQAEKLNVDFRYFKDCSDAFLMTSRGGYNYDRTFMEAFIRPGIGLENWVSRSNYPALNVVQTSPSEMSIYVNQDYAQPTAHLHRYSLRIDGFTSLSAPYEGGVVSTKPFTFSGNELEINYATSAAGEIRFEIINEDGSHIPGFSMEDSEVVIGNEISRIVTWKSNRKLNELSGKVVRMKILMKDADLYSIKFNQ